MKRMTTKIIAVVLALMLALASLPFTAFADGQSELEAAIGRYDAMCTALAGDNGYDNLKTNLSDAYTAYIDALRVLNNVDANGNTVYSSDTDMRNAATALNSALDDCEDFEEYTANVVPKMSGTDADKGYYNKVIYASNDTLTQTTSTPNAKVGYLSRDGAGTTRYYLYYPNAVLLDDGKDVKTVNGNEVNDRPTLPLILGLYKYSSTSYVENFYESTEYFDIMNPYWKGSETATSGTLYWTSTNDNLLHADADEAEIEIYNPGAFVSLKNAMVYYRPTNSDESMVTVASTTWKTQQRYSSTSYAGGTLVDTATKVYILNYYQLIDAIKANLKRFSDSGYFSREYIEQALLEGNGAITDILRPLFNALDAATSFNPSDTDTYAYSSGIAAAAADLQSDMDDIIEKLNLAKPDNVLASINNLKLAITNYEAKMNGIKNTGIIYSNMEDAYEAYVTAKKYANAYDYGLAALKDVLEEAEGDSFDSITHSVDAIAKALNAANDAMVEHTTEYNYIPDEAFQHDTTSMAKSDWYNKSYRNLVWAGKGPERTVDGSSYNDTTAPGLLRLNREYNTTNLYLPRAVAVYDNDNQRFTADGTASSTGAYIASVPMMLGYYNEYNSNLLYGNSSGVHILYNYYIRTYNTSTPEILIAGNWKTGADAQGNAIAQHTISLADITSTGYMVDKVNAVSTTNINNAIGTNGSTSYKETVAKVYTANGYTYFSDAMSPVPDISTNYYYFANRLYINLPDFDSRSGINKYFYEVNNLWAAQSGTDSRNTNTVTTGAVVSGKYGSTSSGLFTGERVTSVAAPSLCIINYKPVRVRIEKGLNVLMAADFDISNYSEGGLSTYFHNMTQLTDVDPYNYAYTNEFDSSENDFVSAMEAYQCATDIYNLLDKQDTKVSIPDSDDAAEILSATGAAPDTLTVEDGTNDSNYYYELMSELGSIEEIRAQYDLTCLDDTEGIYDEYDAAVANAQTAMAQVAVNGYNKTQAEITALIGAIESAAADLQSETTTAPRTMHTARYKERVSSDRTDVMNYETAVFECTRNTTQHHVDTADMSVYDPLQIAVDTIDYERYNNDNIIRNAEAVYDRMTDAVVARRTVGADGVTPQTMVDNAIAAMLTAINTANNGSYDSEYSVTFKTQVGDDGTATQISSESNIVYGNNRTFTVPEASGTVYKWVVETASGKRIRLVDTGVDTDTNPNSYELMVQEDVTVTAYIMPTAADGKVIVKAQNPYGKVGYAYLLNADATIASTESSLTENDKTTVSAGQIVVDGVTFKPGDAAITLSGYTNSSFSLGASVNGKKLSEAAKDGVWTLTLNATKNAPEKCTITYNGTPTQYGTETELITITSTAENFVAIAVKNGDTYTPVSYSQTMQFYSNSDLELVDITTTDRINYYANGTLIAGDAYFYYALQDANKLLPFVSTKMERLSTSNGKSTYGIYSLYANTNNINNGAVEIVEYGSVISRSNENLVIGGADVIKSTAPNHSGYQFSNSLTLAGDFYARGYVKYNYTFVNEDTNEESTIEAIVYSGTVASADLT